MKTVILSYWPVYIYILIRKYTFLAKCTRVAKSVSLQPQWLPLPRLCKTGDSASHSSWIHQSEPRHRPYKNLSQSWCKCTEDYSL